MSRMTPHILIENRVTAPVARVLIVFFGGIAERRLREAFASAGQISEGAADRPERRARVAGLVRGCGGPS